MMATLIERKQLTKNIEEFTFEIKRWFKKPYKLVCLHHYSDLGFVRKDNGKYITFSLIPFVPATYFYEALTDAIHRAEHDERTNKINKELALFLEKP